MAIPSTGYGGAGTEVLRRTAFRASNTTTTLLTVATNHIYTILSISICNNDSTDKAMSLTVKPDGGSGRVLIQGQDMPGESTFVYSDKFVVTVGDEIEIFCSSTATDVYCSYIDQEFAP